MRDKELVDSTDNNEVYKKAYKKYIAGKEGKCSHCPWHDKENARKQQHSNNKKKDFRRK